MHVFRTKVLALIKAYHGIKENAISLLNLFVIVNYVFRL